MFDWKTKIKVFGLSSALLVALQFAACYFCNFVNIQNQANQETRLRSWSLIKQSCNQHFPSFKKYKQHLAS